MSSLIVFFNIQFILMSRTSLGQRNQQRKREQISNLKQVGSGVRIPQQQQLSQPNLNFLEELESFIFMKDKYLKAEAQFNQEVILGQTYTSIKDDFGISIFNNGDRYMGYWKNRLMHGMGIYIFRDQIPIVQTAYLGEFQQGKFCGIGKLANFQQGHGTMIYYGNWFDGKKTSRGRYYYQNPHTNYIGQWINDMKHGQGKLTFPGGQFLGSWVQDQRQGFGRLKKKQGGLIIVYEGVWQKDNLPSGKVTYYDSSNSQVGRYQGQLQEGKKHGKGNYFWRGAIYEGEFSDDCIQGQGSIKLGKTVFKGYFKSQRNILNIPEMRGTLIYENGDIFDGIVSIKDGNVQRKAGIYNFASGDSAEGDFEDNPKGQLLGRFLYRWKNGQQRQFS